MVPPDKYFVLNTTGLEKKKLEFQLVLWGSSSHILLGWGHFLLVLVNNFIRGWLACMDPCPLGK